MRSTLFVTLVAAAACSVPDKQPVDGDAGVDAPDLGPDGAPETTIDDAPAEFAASTSATFAFSSNAPNATFTCSIDSETPVPCTSPYTRTLNDGTHSFSVRAVDRAGNSDDSPAEHVWTIDTAVPNTTMLSGPPAADNSTMVIFEFESNERNVTFECALDSASYAACESGAEVGPIGDGAHSFTVRARDRAGNVDASPAIHTWVVDTSTPDTQMLSGPMGATGSASATFTFVSPDAGAGASYECSLNGAPFTACTSPFTATNLAEREHTFAVRVRDSVGNYDPTPATRTWTVDLTPPQTVIDSGPDGMVPVAIAAFAFSANESNVRYECAFDGAPFAPCTSPASYTNLAQGPHTFAVRGTDMAGHTDPTPATRSWTVDTIAPNVTFTTAPAEGSTSGPRVTFAFTVSEGTPECSVDGGAFGACQNPWSITFGSGTHTFAVRATDGAGNTTTATRSWTVACGPADPTDAAGVLHFEDGGSQTLANATGGAAAILGTTTDPEAVDPSATTGRFGGGLAFNGSENDVVTWPLGLPAGDVTVALWVRADAVSAPRELLVAGGLTITARPDEGNNVAFRVNAGGAQVTSEAAPAAAWHRLVVSIQGDTLYVWFDDSARSVAGVGGPIALDPIRIGGNGFSGVVDDVRVSTTATTTNDAGLAGYCPN